MDFENLYCSGVVPALVVHPHASVPTPDNLAYVGGKALANLLRARESYDSVHIDFLVPKEMSITHVINPGSPGTEWWHSPLSRSGIVISIPPAQAHSGSTRPREIGRAFEIPALGVDVGLVKDFEADVSELFSHFDYRLSIVPEGSEAIRSKARFVGSLFRLVRGIQLRRAGGRWRVTTQAAGRDEGSSAHALLEFCLGHRLVELGLLDTEGMDARYNSMEPYVPEEVVGRRRTPRLRIFDAPPRMVEMTGITRGHDPYLDESFEAPRIAGADALAPFEPTEIAKSESADPDRFLIARHPRQLVCHEPEIVNVRIARTPGPGHAAKLSRFPIPEEGVEVAVRIDGGEDVEFRFSTVQLVRVMPNTDTEWRGFDVVVKRPGEHPVWVTAILDGVEIGRLDIVLQGAEEAGDPSEQETRSTELRSSIGASEDAASIYVQYDISNKRYTLSWHSKNINLIPEGNNSLDPELVFREVEEIVTDIQELVRGDYSVSKTLMDEQMRGHGLRLWEIIPTNMQMHYLQDPSRYKHIRVISTGDPVPWELIVPKRGSGGVDFWSNCTDMRRWFWGDEPGAEIILKKAVLAAPSDAPSQAEEEIESIRGKLQRAGVSVEVMRDAKSLVSALKAGEVNLVHIACHGSYTVDGKKHALMFDNYPLKPDILRNYEGRFRHTPLLVFLSACRTEAKERKLVEMSGWAPLFGRIGADVIIGTLWEVSDKAATTFAVRFYDHLATKSSELCEAIAAARSAAKSLGADPTWLAYTVYGAPKPRVLTPIRPEPVVEGSA